MSDDKGVLVELDNAYYNDEEYNFQAKYSEDHFVIKEFKDDDMDSKLKVQAMQEFKKSLENFEEKLYNENTKWEDITKLIDVESFAKYYLINEFAENLDTYYSSTYLYKDGSKDVIHMGPTWDYDMAFGGRGGINPEEDYTLKYSSAMVYMRELLKYSEFLDVVNRIYDQDLKQYIDKVDVKEYADNIKEAAKINSIAWYIEKSYDKNLNSLNEYINKRKNYFSRRYGTAQLNTNVLYNGAVQNMNWQGMKKSGEVSGTTGQDLRLEGIRISLGNQMD